MASKTVSVTVLLGLIPLAFSFAPFLHQPLLSKVGGQSHAVCRSMPLRTCSLRMTEASSTEVVAGIEDVTDEDQRALRKTHTNKRPKDVKKNRIPITEFKVGSTVPGKVVSIMPFGAFVDIGTTTDGLIHVSQLSDEFVKDISSVVKVGDEVQVRIVTIDANDNKIGLSMRTENLERKPRSAEDGGRQQRTPSAAGAGDRRRVQTREVPDEYINFDAEKVMKGKVVSVLEYGCFVAIDNQLEALVHVSQMSDDRNANPQDLVTVGQEVDVRIVAYDKAKKRLSLSMKAYTEPPPRDEAEDARVFMDPDAESSKSMFQIAWERAQAAAK